MTVADFARAISQAGLEKHGQMVSFLKQELGLTHGNANLVAHTVRERAAGGPPSDEALLDAQYAAGKAALRPIHDRLVEIGWALGSDVDVVVQKSGVSLRRAKQFALIQAPSAKRVQLGLNLAATPEGDRVQAASGMCSHRLDLSAIEEVDDEVAHWLGEAYGIAG